MSFFTEPVHSSHVQSVHNPTAGMGSLGEVSTQEDWPVWSRSSVLQGVPTGTGNRFKPTASLPVASIPTASFDSSFFPAAGLSNLGDTSDTTQAAAAAPPTADQAGISSILNNKVFLALSLAAGTFLVMSLFKPGSK